MQEVGAVSHSFNVVSSTLQPLSVNTSSMAVAQNMADLIDGYCRLDGASESSLIIRPGKGTPESKWSEKHIRNPRIETFKCSFSFYQSLR